MTDKEDIPTVVPFNEEFCSNLEIQIGMAFENVEMAELRGYWCDGISWQPSPSWQLNKKQVNDVRKIVTKAWIGKDGQDEYEMTIHFGKYALRRYARGTALLECIPNPDSMDWIKINTEKKLISIFLK